MKRVFFILGVAIALLFLLSGFSLRENPQDPPRGSKKRHIKMVKEKDGVKTELDTIIEGDGVFVWEGDTIGKAFKCNSEKGGNEFVTSGEGVYYFDDGADGEKHKVVIRTSGNSKTGIPHGMIFEGDSAKCVIVKTECSDAGPKIRHRAIMESEGGNCIFHTSGLPVPPLPPDAPQIKHLKILTGGNVIDLSDPGIISYKKKKLSGGREKIEIIRDEPLPEEEFSVSEPSENIFHIAEPGSDVFKVGPGEKKEIRKVKKIVSNDGKVFMIQEIEGENEKEVEVEVEVEVDEGKNIEKEESGK